MVKVEKSGSGSIDRAKTEGAASVTQTHVERAGHPEASQGTPKDQAALSEQARLLNKAHGAIAELPEVRTERVEGLREQVNSGSYKINLEALARKLLTQLGLR